MSFGKNSGPGGLPEAQTLFGYFPRPPSPSPPFTAPPFQPSPRHSVHQRTQSPPEFFQNSHSMQDFGPSSKTQRPSLSPLGSSTRLNTHFEPAVSQSHRWSPPSARAIDTAVAGTKPTNFPVMKRTRLPSSPSTDPVFQVDTYFGQDDAERELQAKAKRLARFKDELSQPVQSSLGIRNQKDPVKRHDQSVVEKGKFIAEPSDMAGDFPGGNFSADYEGLNSSSVIIGFCPDMCPEPERAERERKGDLDQYERMDGDRNQTSISLAVKKYNRTAEREADLIRPMPILQKTMDYLLNLLDQPYDDSFLGLYNFLWDRMRAIRMDLRMQHIFNLGAITMLEQMIRLHIIAMHELCQYAKGEGFSEGFDAHLNIEQMNKTSVELFQLYDDHRKKGTDVSTEKEFRGYYALLKLDKHPGYKVEPAELSLDLAMMTPEIRQDEQVLFARDVARACRTGNFIAFFRLARKASYLQACLMHAHFGKLRSQALASLHCGLQNNQGIPVSQVAKWLGLEEENIEDLLEYHGFVIKDFEEPYMVKESPFLNGDNEYPLKCSKLVHMKKSRKIIEDVSSPSLMEPSSSEDVKEHKVDKVYVQEVSPVQFKEIQNHAKAIDDDDMPDYESVSSPKDVMHVSEDHDHLGIASPSPGDFIKASSFESPRAMTAILGKPNYDTRFRNSLEKSVHSNVFVMPSQVMPRRIELERLPVLEMVSAIDDSMHQPVSVEDLEFEELADMRQEVETDEVNTTYLDEEVAEAKLKLILRIWRRRSSSKKELREQKQLAANAALSSLSLGPPMRHYNEESRTPGELNIDRVMIERCEKHEQSWSKLNVSNVVAAKLGERNQYARFVCWKIILCSHMDNPDGDRLGPKRQVSCLDAGPWLRSKLMPARSNDNDDLVTSSPGLSIWKKWVYGQSNGNLSCCLSVVKETKFDDLDGTVAGASAILFLVSECIPWEAQRFRLHNLVMSIPCGSHLPLLILSGSYKNCSDPSTVAKILGLDEVDKSRISTFLVISLVKNQEMKLLDGFFSDEQLREGLRWLASETPLQPFVRCVKTRELVLNHLNPSLDVFEEFDAYKVSPDHCISAINEALDRSIEEVANAAKLNLICWPCPEIALLEKYSNEHRAMELYLPSIGWSSSGRIEPLIRALSDCKLPNIQNDLYWLRKGSNMGIDIENQRLQLEDFLIRYLTESTKLMGLPLAQKESSIMLQKWAGLELHDSTYYIVPKWFMIFRRVFNWQLMSLSNGELATAYVLEQHDSSISTSRDLSKLGFEGGISTPYNLIRPSLDEMLEVSCSPDLKYQGFQPLLSMFSHRGEVQNVINRSELMGEERNLGQDSKWAETNSDDEADRPNNNGSELLVETKVTKETDRLSKLLEQCNIVQTMIDKKLSIYF